MKRGLLDYMQENPYLELEPMPCVETEEDALKRKISEGLDQGSLPEVILQDALSLIGKLSHNQAWADEQKDKLKANEKPVKPIDIPL